METFWSTFWCFFNLAFALGHRTDYISRKNIMLFLITMIYLASDHRGMIRKEEIKKLLDEMNEEYQDCGNLILDPEDDEVDLVNKACEKIGEGDKGIFFCGSGVM